MGDCNPHLLGRFKYLTNHELMSGKMFPQQTRSPSTAFQKGCISNLQSGETTCPRDEGYWGTPNFAKCDATCDLDEGCRIEIECQALLFFFPYTRGEGSYIKKSAGASYILPNVAIAGPRPVTKDHNIGTRLMSVSSVTRLEQSWNGVAGALDFLGYPNFDWRTAYDNYLPSQQRRHPGKYEKFSDTFECAYIKAHGCVPLPVMRRDATSRQTK